MILQMRREKKAQKEKEATALGVKQEPFVVTAAKTEAVAIALCRDNRTITNNIFNVRFELQPQEASVSQTVYDVFFVDSDDRIISDVQPLTVQTTQDVYKVTLSLIGQGNYDKTQDYFLVWRYEDAGMNILGKVPYTINIAFASDFDF